MDFYQIYYKDEHLKHLYPFAKPYYNEGLTIFFENEPISRLVMESKADKIAVCSWRLHQKTRNIFPVTMQALESNYEVMAFRIVSKKHTMIAAMGQWHKDAVTALDLLWTKLGYKRPGEARHPIYMNHYAARTEIYQDYVRNFLIPAIELIKTDEQLNEIMLRPSGYGRLSKDSDLKSVQSKLGMNDYPLCPFVLERCPSLWYEMKGVRISYLPMQGVLA